MMRPTPRSTRTDTLVPYPTPFRAVHRAAEAVPHHPVPVHPVRVGVGRAPVAVTAPGALGGVPGGQLGGRVEAGREGTTRLQGGEHGEQLERGAGLRSEEHTSELQSLMRISYAVFCLKKKKKR